MKRILIVTCFICSFFLAASAKDDNSRTYKNERAQWTEKQAWKWEKQIGVIKGFNEPKPAYPGMEMEDIIRRMSELGFNSIRGWFGGANAEEQVERIREIAGIADKYGMTVAPVLYLHRDILYRNAPEEQNLKDAQECIRTIVRPFRNDRRIIMWDLWNEPALYLRDSVYIMKEMDWIEQEVHWCRSEHLSQPITASIFWDTDMKTSDVSSKYFQRRMEVEMMMDIHNFHDYKCSQNFGEDARVMIQKMRKMGNRPLVCTECLTRVNGSGIGRTLAEFAPEHVHFYIWGAYSSDANWDVKWRSSSYDPYDVSFHNLLYADGDPMDERDIELVKNYSFSENGHVDIEDLEITERWSHERAWKRMVTGPVKGICDNADITPSYNSVCIKLDYSAYSKDRDAFFNSLDQRIAKAAEDGYTLLPILLTDDDADQPVEKLGEYVSAVTERYYCSPHIIAWDLYNNPGKVLGDREKVLEVILTAFRHARNSYTNQPLTCTPYVKVKPFDENFDFWGALVHGRYAGWGKLDYEGCSDPELVNRIWSLSDVISFASEQGHAETGWLASICFRYGRPIFCTRWDCPSESDLEKTLERFAASHVFWYSSKPVPEENLSSFRFRPIVTEQVTDE